MDPAATHRHPDDEDEYSGNRRSGKFRFKKHKSSRRHREEEDDHDDDHRRSHHRRERRPHHHRRHHHHRHHHDHPSRKKRSKHFKISDDNDSNRLMDEGELSPDAAFRESLFDALGDDEGADYWESVYGQPMHTYPIPSVAKGPQGGLERMSDDEYVSYVRARMWERTHEGIMEERERLRAERARAKQRRRDLEAEARERAQFENAIQDSLRRGQERKSAKAWVSAWRDYRRSWEELDRLAAVATKTTTAASDGEKKSNSKDLSKILFWPVASGKRKDVSPESVQEFVRHAPPTGPDADRRLQARNDLLAILKSERVRWHPDKIQHRYGVLGIEQVVMQSVTQVFQIIDQMWTDEREKQD